MDAIDEDQRFVRIGAGTLQGQAWLSAWLAVHEQDSAIPASDTTGKRHAH
jgi:hypothetical protein